MKQIANTNKKAYMAPSMRVIGISQADIICTSGNTDPDPTPEPHGFDDELD